MAECGHFRSGCKRMRKVSSVQRRVKKKKGEVIREKKGEKVELVKK